MHVMTLQLDYFGVSYENSLSPIHYGGVLTMYVCGYAIIIIVFNLREFESSTCPNCKREFIPKHLLTAVCWELQCIEAS